MRVQKSRGWFHPMLFLYVWIILDFSFNIVWLVFNVKASALGWPLVIFLPATFRILVGVE